LKNLKVEEARSILLRAARPLEEEEEVELWEAYDRVLARDAVAGEDIPSFDRSAMDGYALRSGDTLSPPVRLRVVGEVPAGRLWTGELEPGTAVAISTGAPLPRGADAVNSQE
jgi:molybdopterin molybdotransferase